MITTSSSDHKDCCLVDQVAEDILTQMVADGYITPDGYDDDGKPMYRLTDVWRAEARAAREARRHKLNEAASDG